MSCGGRLCAPVVGAHREQGTCPDDGDRDGHGRGITLAPPPGALARLSDQRLLAQSFDCVGSNG